MTKDAEFIAHSREDISFLLKELDEARADKERLKAMQRVLVTALEIARANAKHNRIGTPDNKCWTTCAACAIQEAIDAARQETKEREG